MLLLVALLVFFCLVGLTARDFSIAARWALLVGVVALVVVDYMIRAFP